MRSDNFSKGVARAPHRSLLKALGFVNEEIGKPVIGIANSFNEIIPGHMHLRNLVQAVKDGIREAGGIPMEFNTIGICDGTAMNHIGMKYSLVTRQIVADSIEATAMATPFDGLVFIPNCDKIVPGMLMAAARLNLPSVFVSGSDARRATSRQTGRPQRCIRSGRQGRSGAHERGGISTARRYSLSDLRLLLRDVHGEHHELPHRSFGHGSSGERYDTGGILGTTKIG